MKRVQILLEREREREREREKRNVPQLYGTVDVKVLTRLKELKFAALDLVKSLRQE